MNRLGFFGTEEALEELALSQQARLLVISDTHGSFDIFKRTIQRFGAQSSALVFCGDGMNDLITYFNQMEHDRSMKDSLPPAVFFVRGNGDADTYRLDEKVIQVPRAVTLTAAGRNILAVHGHMYSVDFGTDMLAQAAHAHSADIAFYGHTHRPAFDETRGIYCINPGSTSRPRGESNQSCAAVTVVRGETQPSVAYYSVN